MLQVILKRSSAYYAGANRFWIPLVCGLLYALCLPPFSAMLHPALAPMPILSFVALIPLFFFATRSPRKRALVHTYIYCAAMILGQLYWIGFVTAEGYWVLILVGVALISIAWGALYFAAALAFRYCARRLPRLYIAVYPAVWVLVEYFRTLTDLAFPWAYIGCSASGILPLAQFASFTGVWGLSYIIVLGNVAIWELLRSYKSGANVRQNLLTVGAWAALTVGIVVWGAFRMNMRPPSAATSKVAIMQSYMDQFNWGSGSLDTALTVSDSMVKIAAKEKPDLIVFSESSVLCYLDRRPDIRRQVLSWAKNADAPIIVGSLHWDPRPPKDPSSKDKEYDVYNSLFLTDGPNLLPYHKILLVPFSEIMPFEAKFPILSRVNLGGASFKRGAAESTFRINASLEIAPYICYEIVFPDFVRRRLNESTNLLVNITNDGWFGRTSGPYQHAAMAQMRSIENGIAQARSANSGISMFVDQYGRISSKTKLYTRDMVIKEISTDRVMTFYTRFGDWFVVLCGMIVVAGIVISLIKKPLPPATVQTPIFVDEESRKLGAVNAACQSERV